MRNLLPLSILLLSITGTQAQQVQKCCGTNNSTFLLGNTSYARHSQCLYLPDDLTGEQDGLIQRLYYRYGTTGEELGNTLTGLQIGFVQTDETTFANELFFTGVTVAFASDTFTIAPGTSGEWFMIELDQPFQYDASKTLVVDISFQDSEVTNFGTMCTHLEGRKLYSDDPSSPTGEMVVSSWQDIGFDLDISTGVEVAGPMITLLSPVPTHDMLYVRVPPGTPIVSLQVLDMSGRMLMRYTPRDRADHSIDVSGLSPGTYLLMITDHTGATTGDRFIRR